MLSDAVAVVHLIALAVTGAALTLFGLVLGALLPSRPVVSVEDHSDEDEPLEVDPPTSRPYIPRGGPIPPGLWAAERDEDELLVPAKPLHRLCVVAYTERDYAAICKTCTPRMGVKA